MSTDVVLYGLTIRSEVPLPGRRVPAVGRPDLEVVIGPDIPAPAGAPPGVVLAHFQLNPSQWYTFSRPEDGTFLLRFAGTCDFVLDPALRRAEVRQVEGAAPDMVSVFATGSLPSFVLVMKGQPVLHASAVDFGGRVLAFVGRSGMGKSTMATLSCAAGGRLVTDDVLRLTPGPGPRCYLGPEEIRLRSWATELTTGFAEAPPQRVTGDGRSAVQPPMGNDDLLPLAAIVVPLPDRAITASVVERQDPVQSLLTLMSFPRLLGWREPVAQAQQFQLMSEVSACVPVYRARIPWGPPFPPGVVNDILEATGFAASRSAG